MAFQPIVDCRNNRVYAYEALVRGPNNEPAMSVLSQLTPENRYSFDQSCRVTALQLASRLGLAQTGALLSINFMPGAVYSPAACIQLTLATARRLNFPMNQLMFEITENERVASVSHLRAITAEYHRHGFRIALDDFGECYSNLNLLAELSAGVLKLDMGLIRGIHSRPRAQVLVEAMVETCKRLEMDLIAEGVETMEEFFTLQSCGIHLMQGYLFARPGFEQLPAFSLPRFHPERHTVRQSAAA